LSDAGLIRHGGLIALRLRGVWRGVLIEGPSGAGKSDLALRALDQGFSLVADDRVSLWVSESVLYGTAPQTLSGLLEVRGLQVVQVTALPLAEVALIARCGVPERIPEPAFAEIAGVSVPTIEIDPRDASAPAKLRRALDLFDAAHKRRI
jgi:serine kinase of HPr protein (carbohydrate metabolism regulator)